MKYSPRSHVYCLICSTATPARMLVDAGTARRGNALLGARALRPLVAAAALVILAACGGGGGAVSSVQPQNTVLSAPH